MNAISEKLKPERDDTDESLTEERDEADSALIEKRARSELLPLEREKTDRFLLEERLRSDEALAQRDDFMSMVSHDLRDLLHGILLNAQVLSTNASDSEEGHRTVEGMDQVQRYVARMNRLIGDLVDVVSIDAGRLAIQAEPDDAATVLAEAVQAFAPAVADKKVSLELELTQRTLKAEFDRDRMLQVLSNLLSNALKFTPSGGAISVRGELSRNALDVSVSDTGIGIRADELDAIFERFWQVGKNDRRGLGLGLYISKCIVEGHGGSIRVQSKPGEGSVFSLTIPRRAGPA